MLSEKVIATQSFVGIRHLRNILHPASSQRKFMLMLTAYSDDTGHPDDPSLRFCGMAGFVAPLASWQKFEKRWQPTLDKYGLTEPFHMKHFAHSEGQFKEWKNQETKRRELYGELMEIIKDTGAEPVGAIVSLNEFSTLTEAQQSAFHGSFMVAFQSVTHGFAINGVPTNEKVAMVYSYQQEFGVIETKPFHMKQAGTAEQLWHHIKDTTDYGEWMGPYASSTPKETVQLQAADVFAYELSKDFENQVLHPHLSMRWGLKQILRMSLIPLPMIQLFRRKDLLKIIKRNGWPESEGTDEVNLHEQDISAVAERVQWAKERGEWDDSLSEI